MPARRAARSPWTGGPPEMVATRAAQSARPSSRNDHPPRARLQPRPRRVDSHPRALARGRPLHPARGRAVRGVRGGAGGELAVAAGTARWRGGGLWIATSILSLKTAQRYMRLATASEKLRPLSFSSLQQFAFLVEKGTPVPFSTMSEATESRKNGDPRFFTSPPVRSAPSRSDIGWRRQPQKRRALRFQVSSNSSRLIARRASSSAPGTSPSPRSSRTASMSATAARVGTISSLSNVRRQGSRRRSRLRARRAAEHGGACSDFYVVTSARIHTRGASTAYGPAPRPAGC
jgi:hypothetical protein